jgi:hypothetical protein
MEVALKTRTYIDDESCYFKIYMKAETHGEAQEIYEACQRSKKCVKSFGTVGLYGVWAWFFIPIKKNNIGQWRYFGNDRK